MCHSVQILCASILTACHECNHNCFHKVPLLLSYWAIHEPSRGWKEGGTASPSYHKTAVNAAGEVVVVDTIYWFLSAAAKVTSLCVACAASIGVFLELLLPPPLLSLLLKWCGQSGMDDCIGNLFMEMVFAVGTALAPFWWQQHAVEMEKRFPRQLEIPSTSS